MPVFGTCTCNFPGIATACDSYQDSSRIILYVATSVAANTVITGTINMMTPYFRYLVPPVGANVRVIVFFRTRI